MANTTDCNMNRETQQKSQNQSNFESLDKTAVSTLKRNPKIEFCKTDLLKLLTYLEGELQARDIVIATLKSEKIKQYLVQNRHHSLNDNNEPLAALQRDSFAVIDHNRDSSEMYLLVNQQLNSLENLVTQQKRSQARVARVLKEAELRHRKEMEIEIQNRKRFEKEYLKLNEILEAERNRQKQIVLFLLAERKKIIMKYVEERKRSEDLAQILAEEKGRVDAMAEGLEEESKKSLQMEAELEKQLAQFFVETQQLKLNLSKQEQRSKELEAELEKSEKENILLRQQLTDLKLQHDRNSVPNPLSTSIDGTDGSSSSVPSASSAGLQCVTPMMTSIAKVVQPTATVSSVPVSGPMTGIARSVSPGHPVRYVMYSPMAPNTPPSAAGKMIDPSQYVSPPTQQEERRVPPVAPIRSATINNSPHPKLSASPIVKNHSGGGVGEMTIGTVARKPIPLGRGVPPPVPPNKPIIPPKKDGILNRKLEAVCGDNSSAASDGKNSQPRGPPVLPNSVKVKLPISERQNEDEVKNNSVTETPG